MMPDWQIDVLRGAAAARVLTPDRTREWQGLVNDAKKVAVFQSPGFALTWYEVYEPDYEPLVLTARGTDGRLLGVMPLALPRSGGAGPVFAGDEQADYTGWLAAPALEDDFPALCVVRLFELGVLPGAWRWKALASGTGLAWLGHPALRDRGITGRVSDISNPLWTLYRENGRGFLAQHESYKRKLRRLKKLGDVRLVQLDAASLTDEMFDAFKRLYDIRQLARYGVAPFSEYPRKELFHRRLLERMPESVLFFALMAGAAPVAFKYDLADKRRAIGCITAFDPLLPASSPGKLIRALLADRLAERGIDEIDLTPGGEYKGEFANHRETIHALHFFSTASRARLYAATAQLRRPLKAAAVRAGITRGHLGRARELLSRMRAHSALGLARAALRPLRRWTWSTSVSRIYRLDPNAALAERMSPRASRAAIRKDALEDFLLYTGSDRWHSRQRLMAEAINRRAAGEHCYTVVEDGVLVHYAWLELSSTVMNLSGVGAYYPTPGSAVLYDSYTEPRARGRGLHKRSLIVRARDAFAMGADRVLTGVVESNAASSHNHEALGFRLDRRLVQRRLLGRSRRWELLARS